MNIFVLMPFKEEFEPVYSVIRDVAQKKGCECARADTSMMTQPIMKDIIENIYQSDLIVSDLSELNPNVLYETGIAHTIGCKTIMIMDSDTIIPFDLSAFRLIRYRLKNKTIDDAEAFKSAIGENIDEIKKKKKLTNPVQEYTPQKFLLFSPENRERYFKRVYTSLVLQRSVPRKRRDHISSDYLRVLAISPHADDVAQGCLGTLFYLQDYYKAHVYIEILVPGIITLITENGSSNKRLEQLKQWSRQCFASELITTSDLSYDKKPDHDFHVRIGCRDPINDPIKDSNFDCSVSEIRKRFNELQQAIAPDIVLVPSLTDTHQDHKTVAESAIQVFRRGEGIWHYEIPHLNNSLQNAFNPNLYVDISSTPNAIHLSHHYDSFAHAKVETLFNSFSDTESNKWWFSKELFLANMRKRAVESHQTHDPDCKDRVFAEAFEAKIFISEE